MHRILLSLTLLFIALPALAAAEPGVGSEPVPSVVATPGIDAPAAPAAAMQLEEVRIEGRSAKDVSAAAQLGPRGGFWWMVGVIVVAGVILAIVL